MLPIVLNRFGDTLLRYPKLRSPEDHLHSDDDEKEELNSCVGVHADCKGWIDIRCSSTTYNALCCRMCNMRIPISVAVKTFGDLREFSKNKMTSEEVEGFSVGSYSYMYMMAIRNVVKTIHDPRIRELLDWDVFHAASVLSVAFCQPQKIILADLMKSAASEAPTEEQVSLSGNKWVDCKWKARAKYKGDPVVRRRDGKYFFYDEVWLTRYGPYETEEDCDVALRDYGDGLEGPSLDGKENESI